MAWHRVEDASLLFYGADVIVLAKHFGAERCVITFTSRMNAKDMPPAPFGAGLCEEAGCSYICFIATRNHWWQVDEFQHALVRVESYLTKMGYAEVVAYGGSMGGVAAVHASKILPLDRAVLFSAQYDISADVVPWDPRWSSDASELKISLKPGSDAASRQTEFIYIYDSFSLDRRHFNIFAQFLNFVGLDLPFSGHENFRTLKEIGLAGDIAKTLLFSDLSTEEKIRNIRTNYRERRRKSVTYWKNVSDVATRKGRLGLADHALGQVERSETRDLGTLHALALAYLSRRGDPVRAEEIYDRCIQIDPDHPAAWRGKAKCRQAKNDPASAVEFALAAFARNPASADLCRVLIEAAFRADDKTILGCAALSYLSKFPGATEEVFFRKHVTREALESVSADTLAAFEAGILTIRNRVPRRYSQLLHCLSALRPRTIVEIGVFNAENAKQMLAAASLNVAAAPFYYGFDLFEDMTEEVNAKEFSKIPLKEDDVAKKISNVIPKYKLYKGYTQKTLPLLGNDMAVAQNSLEFVFIDGGHSEETIQSDWKTISSLMTDKSVIIFDDYYVNKSLELDGAGCNSIVGDLEADENYEVEILPVRDVFQKASFVLTVAMVKVRLSRRRTDG